MNTAVIELFGGPFDGHTEQHSASESFDVTRCYRPDHAPETAAIYRLRLVMPGAPRRLVYLYQGTVTTPPA